MKKNKNNKELFSKSDFLRIVLFVVLSFCYLIFFFNTDGHLILKADVDGEFHFSRIMSLSNIWQSPVNFHYYNHTGQIVNLMYPWATVYPMYWIIKLTGSIVGGYYIYFLILTFATLEITYQCLRHMKQKSLSSILSAVLYTFAICRTSDIYCRADVGETISMTIFPIVLLGIYRLFYLEKPYWKTLVVGMTLLVYTHVLSLIIASVMVAFFTVLSIIHKHFNVKRLIGLLKAIGMSILLGLGFLVPMLQVMATVKINGPQLYDLYVCALKPIQLWEWSLQNAATTRDLYGAVFLVVIIAILLNMKKIKGFFKDTLIGTAFFTFISTTLFPWGIFQKQFEMLQFPWRFITIATLLLCVTASELMRDYELGHSSKQSKVALFFLTLMIVVSHWGVMNDVYKWNGNNKGNDNTVYVEGITKNVSFNGYGDYNPASSNDDDGYISAQQIRVNQQWVPVKHKVSSNTMTYELKSDGEATAIFPVYAFPGEKLIQNGIPQSPQVAQADGATQVNLVDGKNKIRISYGYSILARIAWTVSLIVFLIFNGNMLYKKYKKQA